MIIKPPYGRQEIFSFLEKEFLERKNLIMVEIGMTRKKGNWEGDGYSTPHFGWIANKTSSQFYSIDISLENNFICENILEEYGLLTEGIYLICDDGLVFLQDWVKENKPLIDFLYLDAWDWIGSEENKRQSEINHLEAFKIIELKLKDGCYILIDDVADKFFTGKGKLLIPYMIEKEYNLVKLTNQALFKKT